MDTNKNLEPGIPIKTAAEAIGVSIQTVRREVKNGGIRAYMCGGKYLFKPTDIDSYIEARRVKSVNG